MYRLLPWCHRGLAGREAPQVLGRPLCRRGNMSPSHRRQWACTSATSSVNPVPFPPTWTPRLWCVSELVSQTLRCNMSNTAPSPPPTHTDTEKQEETERNRVIFWPNLGILEGKKNPICNTVFLARNGAESIFWHP